MKAKSASASSGSDSKPKAKPKRGWGDPSPYMDRIRRAVARHPEFARAAGRYGYFDPTSPLVGLIQQESKFDPNAESPTGALGLGQFTGIGRQDVSRVVAMEKYGSRFDDTPGMRDKLLAFGNRRSDSRIPDIAIEASALCLAYLFNLYGENLEAALTHYNAGSTAAKIVQKHGSHAAALSELNSLPVKNEKGQYIRSQSPTYAPDVLAWTGQYDASIRGGTAVA